MINMFQKRKKAEWKKVMKKGMAAGMAFSVMASAIAGGNVVNAASGDAYVDNVHLGYSLSTGNTSEQAVAKIWTISGQPITVKATAKIYYRSGTGYYYSTSGEKNGTASVTATVKTGHSPATVEQKKGEYRASYNGDSINRTLTIGSLTKALSQYTLQN